jgi:hypothetical protein
MCNFQYSTLSKLKAYISILFVICLFIISVYRAEDCCDDVIDNFVADMIVLGLIVDMTDYGVVYVSRLWYQLSYSDKENFMTALALYHCCHNVGIPYIEIKDGYSGKKGCQI